MSIDYSHVHNFQNIFMEHVQVYVLNTTSLAAVVLLPTAVTQKLYIRFTPALLNLCICVTEPNFHILPDTLIKSILHCTTKLKRR
jgi:hypothetical protein